MSAGSSRDRARLRKIAILLVVIVAVALFFAFGLHRYLTLDAVKAYQAELADTYRH